MNIVVTGATSGIGLATATALAKQGHTVIGLARHAKTDLPFESLQCDMTNFESVNAVFLQIAKKYGRIDALVNNAGMGIAGAIEHTDMADVEKQFALNVLAVINACKCVTPIMREGGGGKIINIGSVAGVVPIPFQACYSATKSAIDMFSMAFGLEVKPFGVQLCVVMPGDTKTGFTASRVKNQVLIDENYNTRIAKSIEKMEHDEQHGKPPESVANVIANLLQKRKLPTRKTVGGAYKLIVLLQKIVPRKLMLWVVKKIYG